MEHIHFVAGPSVTGESFFGRQNECRRILAQLDARASSLWIGQRRVGKTSLLRQVQEVLVPAHFPSAATAFINAEFVGSEAEFVKQVAEALRPALGDDLEPSTSATNYEVGLTARLGKVVSRGRSILLFIDEVDALLTRAPSAAMLLRNLVSRGTVLAVCASFRWPDEIDSPVGSSPWFNVYTIDPLPLFALEEADSMLEHLSAKSGRALTKRERAFLIDVFGPHPFYLQSVGLRLFEDGGFVASARPHRQLLVDASEVTAARLEPHLIHAIEHFSESELAALRTAAATGSVDDSHVANRLRRKGLIVSDGSGKVVLTSRLVAEFVLALPAEKPQRTGAAWRFFVETGKKAVDIALERAVSVAAERYLV